MLHDVLIVLHAAAGVACFAAGVLALRPATGGPFRVYYGCLVAMLLFLVAAVAVAWPGLATSARLIDLGLAGLGTYMLWRATHVGTLLTRQGSGRRGSFLDDIGFRLISLFDGFVIVEAREGARGQAI
jgi:hypothetical protein